MNYEEMCQAFDLRRKEELVLCSVAIRTAVDLYATILETNQRYFKEEWTPTRSASNKLCATLEKLYDALTEMDDEIEKAMSDPPPSSTVVYNLDKHQPIVQAHPQTEGE